MAMSIAVIVAEASPISALQKTAAPSAVTGVHIADVQQGNTARRANQSGNERCCERATLAANPKLLVSFHFST
jgi:hypothetical protein